MGKMARIGDLFQSELLANSLSFEQASLTDPLTGLPNRRALVRALQTESNGAQRLGIGLTLAIGEADPLKDIPIPGGMTPGMSSCWKWLGG